MTLFPEAFFTAVIYIGIFVAGLSALLLAGLWLKDMKGKSLW
jgi:hypothetical protein